MNWSLVLNTALIDGVVLSLVITTIMTISASIALDMWVGDYPPDIRERYGPMSPRAARIRPIVVVLFVVALVVIPLLGLSALRAQIAPIPFLAALVYSVTVLLVFNVFDLIVLDWLLFCTIQPRQMTLPGTRGMPGYRDYHFHFIGFLKGLGFSAVGGLLIASLWMAAQWLIQ